MKNWVNESIVKVRSKAVIFYKIMKPIISLFVMCVLGCQLKAQVSFSPSSTNAVGNNPFTVVATDVNGDGKADLICANSSDNTLTVLTNSGGGGFVLSGTYSVGSEPHGVTAADVNGDGKVDLISANADDSTLSVLTNDGSSGFAFASTLSVGWHPISVTEADVKGDGKVDLISANQYAYSLSVLTNDGLGGFAPASTPEVGNAPVSVVAADVNGDGKLDLVSANGYDNTLSVLTNDGSGGFMPSGTYPVGNQPNCVTAADVNGDGKMDLICVNNSDNTLTVLTNDGSGGFVTASTLNVGNTPYSVTAADVNGDGWVDLICANAGDNTLMVFTNNGSGVFGSNAVFNVGNYPVTVTAADINGDGKMDLICANYFDNTLMVLTNSTPFPSSTLPLITAPPAGTTNLVNTRAALGIGVTAAGIEAARQFAFQWQLNGTNLPAMTNKVLVLPNLSPSKAGNYDVVVSNYVGSVTSAVAAVAVVYPPSITVQPTNQVLSAGSVLDLEVGASGTAPLTYQWQNGTGAMPGQTNSGLILNPALTNDTDNYSVIVSNSYSAVTSQVASVFVYLPVSFLTQPYSLVVPALAPATFSVNASGFPEPTSYQWTFNGTNLPGATSSSLIINRVHLANTGSYQVLASNGYSVTNSDIATLNMSPSITSPFTGVTAIWGQGASLSVAAIGSGGLGYQWYLNGVAIDGATGATLNFDSIQFTNGGLYSVVVGSPYGSVTNVAQVVVNPATISIGFYPGLTINGAVGNSYIIQGSTNLADTNAWVTLTNLTLTQPVQLWIDTSVDASSPFNPLHYYQVLPQQ